MRQPSPKSLICQASPSRLSLRMAVGLILFGVAWLGVTAAAADSNVGARRLVAGAISVTVPPGWHGKVFRRAPEGSVLLQLANLPFVYGEVPKQQPAREIVVTILGPARPNTGSWHSLNARLFRRDFLPRESPRVPSGHALAIKYIRVHGRRAEIDVDFAHRPVATKQLRWINQRLLSTLAAR
jgi:hypothetical protein